MIIDEACETIRTRIYYLLIQIKLFFLSIRDHRCHLRLLILQCLSGLYFFQRSSVAANGEKTWNIKNNKNEKEYLGQIMRGKKYKLLQLIIRGQIQGKGIQEEDIHLAL